MEHEDGVIQKIKQRDPGRQDQDRRQELLECVQNEHAINLSGTLSLWRDKVSL
jgi:hypothetical protein